MRVVMLTPYPAFPPHGGGVQRMYQLIRSLSQRHEIWCLGLAPDATAMEAAEPPAPEKNSGPITTDAAAPYSA